MIRDATAEDIAWLAAASTAIYAQDFARLAPGLDPAPFDAAHFGERFASAFARIRIADEEAKPLGFCLLTGDNIDMLFVLPEARRTGAGRMLLRDAEARGAARLECFAANWPARRFYEREGWRAGTEYVRLFGGHPQSFVEYRKG